MTYDGRNQGQRFVDVCNERLTRVLGFPPNAVKLSLNANRLVEIPAIPDSVKILEFKSNRVERIHNFPKNLEFLNCTNNRLVGIPEFSEGVETVIVRDNQLIALPRIPKSVRCLDISNNRVSVVPDLPGLMCYMDISCNPLLNLPKVKFQDRAFVVAHFKFMGLDFDIRRPQEYNLVRRWYRNFMRIIAGLTRCGIPSELTRVLFSDYLVEWVVMSTPDVKLRNFR